MSNSSNQLATNSPNNQSLPTRIAIGVMTEFRQSWKGLILGSFLGWIIPKSCDSTVSLAQNTKYLYGTVYDSKNTPLDSVLVFVGQEQKDVSAENGTFNCLIDKNETINGLIIVQFQKYGYEIKIDTLTQKYKFKKPRKIFLNSKN
ncbi:MAG: hypothetical protein IPN76_16650 [Saprospiraceae bacterium]|nr:hypothetical protein [Saprospiraceae bacterium]